MGERTRKAGGRTSAVRRRAAAIRAVRAGDCTSGPDSSLTTDHFKDFILHVPKRQPPCDAKSRQSIPTSRGSPQIGISFRLRSEWIESFETNPSSFFEARAMPATSVQDFQRQLEKSN